jgi:hypothetical protein
LKIKAIGVVLFLVSIFACNIRAEETQEPQKEKAVPPQEFVTQHKVQAGNEVVAYTAIAGETILKDDGPIQLRVRSHSSSTEGQAPAPSGFISAHSAPSTFRYQMILSIPAVLPTNSLIIPIPCFVILT